MNTIEVEQKFVVSDLKEIESKLSQLGAQHLAPIRQRDLYFAHPQRDFSKTDEALRLRQSGSQCCITYKGPKLDSTTKTRHEIELPLATAPEDLEQFEKLLIALGFRPVAEVRKTRLPGRVQWQGRWVDTALDKVDEVGEYAELEILADDDAVDDAKACIQSLAAELKLCESERRSYLELLLSGR